MPSPRNVIIKLSDISVRYDRNTVLDSVDMTVRKGDFVAITGPNGGGKTTLLRVILKLLKPSAGSVDYFDAAGNKVKRLHIGYLPQRNNIDTRFPITAGEVIRSGLLHGFFGRASSSADNTRFDEIVSLTGTQEYLSRSVGDLSGGQLQRVLLGRALISDPEIVVLDEPLSYVDKTFEHQIYHIMEEVASKATIILVSHEMSVISRMANVRLIVNHGLREDDGRPDSSCI